MEQAFDFIRMPRPGMGTVLVVVFFLGGLLFLAVLMDMIRRAKDRRARIDSEWLTIKDIIKAKDLSEREWATLVAMINHHAPLHPLDTVTIRKKFNECVSAHMAALYQAGDMGRFEEEGLLLRDIRIRLSLDFVAFGQRLETSREFDEYQAFLAARTGDARPHWCRLHMMRIDEAYMHISIEHLKTEENKPIWKPGDVLQCRMWREDDARYTFEAKVADSDLEQEELKLYHTEQLDRIQSRAYYRVGHNQPTNIGIVSYPADGDFSGIENRPVSTHVRGRITSLSAGGVAVETTQSLSSRVIMRLTLDMAGADPILVNVAIVGESRLSAGRFLIRGFYVGMDDSSRDVIAQYIWRRQQPLHKKEDEAY